MEQTIKNAGIKTVLQYYEIVLTKLRVNIFVVIYH